MFLQRVDESKTEMGEVQKTWGIWAGHYYVYHGKLNALLCLRLTQDDKVENKNVKCTHILKGGSRRIFIGLAMTNHGS